MGKKKPNKFLKYIPSDYLIYILETLNINKNKIEPNTIVSVNDAYLIYLKKALPKMNKNLIMSKFFNYNPNAQRTKFYQTHPSKTALFDVILKNHGKGIYEYPKAIKKEIRARSRSPVRSRSPSRSPVGSRSSSPVRSKKTKTKNQSTSTRGLRKYRKHLKLHTFANYLPREFPYEKLKKHESAMVVHPSDGDINVPKPIAKLIRQRCQNYDKQTKRYKQLEIDGSEDTPVFLEFTY